MPDFLYIHIPFCIRKCIYCDFLSVPYDKSYARKYIDALCKELTLKKDSAKIINHPHPLPPPSRGRVLAENPQQAGCPTMVAAGFSLRIYAQPKGCGYNMLRHEIVKRQLSDNLQATGNIELKTIYIGGGTPSLLPDECFRQLFRCLRNNFNFSPSIEITVEANPGTINESKINTLLSLGINRLSIGVQSFNNDELRTLGRIHTSEDAIRSIELIRKAGLRNFSIDLMYGIPGQTMDSWHNTISKAVGLSPTHISAYELTPEKGTPLYKMIESTHPLNSPLAKGGHRGVIDMGMGGFSHKIKLPDEELILEMYNHAIDYLASFGYEHYEISNFALPGFRCIHNLNYWDRGEYIGAGAGAHSFINGWRSKNTEDINRYIEDLNTGIIPEIESTKLTSVEAIKEFIFLGLRKTEGININDLTSRVSRYQFCHSALDACRELVDEGYLEIEGNYLRLTRKGIVISNTIIVRMFERLRLD